MKKKIKKIILIGLAAVVLIATVIYLLLPLSVAGLVLEAGSYQQVIEEQGILTAERRWNLYAPESLPVAEILAAEGTLVQAGEPILRFDDSLLLRQHQANQNALQLQLGTLEGELSSVRAQKQQYGANIQNQTRESLAAQQQDLQQQLASAQMLLDGQEALFAEGFISQAQLDQARLNVSALQSKLQEVASAGALQLSQLSASYQYYNALESSLQGQISALTEQSPSGDTDSQSAQLAYLAEQTLLTAPADGAVLQIAAGLGEIADPTRPIVSIYEPGLLGLEAYVLASEAALVYPGMEAEVVTDAPEGKLRLAALVVAVSPQAAERTSELGLAESRVKVTLTLPESGGLLVGQTVDVRLIRSAVTEAVAVPKTAVFAYETGFAVMLVEGGRARLQPVEKEFETDTLVVIRSGLTAGDTVILTPQMDGLRKGKRVSVR